jgi:hypothetical protein
MPEDPQQRYDRQTGPRDRSLRVGDREREAVAEILRREHVNGRLDAVEFQERLDRCLAAKTYTDLDALIADFPTEAEERRRARHSSGWRPRPVALPFLFLPLALVTAILVAGHLFWLAVPLLFLFVGRHLGSHPRGGGYACGPWPPAGPRRSGRA